MRRIIPQEPLPVTFDVRGRRIEITDELRNAVEKIVACAIDRFDAQVAKVSVYLADLNGPKGGVDKLCQITASLRRGNPVLILKKGFRDPDRCPSSRTSSWTPGRAKRSTSEAVQLTKLP